MDIRDIFVYYSACIKSRYNFSIGYRSSTSAMELIEMFVREFFPRLKKRALGNYRSNLRKSIRGHFQLSIPLFESFEEENFVNNIISFRHFARRKCFSKQLFFPANVQIDANYVIPYRIEYEIAVAFILTLMRSLLYTSSCTVVSLSLDRRPSKSSKLHISKQSIDSVTGHEYYRRNWSSQQSKDTNIFSSGSCNA